MVLNLKKRLYIWLINVQTEKVKQNNINKERNLRVI